jgi:two-component system sporulation sensor kinase A
MSPGKELHLEFKVIHKRGHSIPCTSKLTLFMYEKKIVGFNTINNDITDSKKAEEALQESEKRICQLVDLSPDIIAIHSEGKIDFVNRTGARLLGATNPKQIMGKPIMDFLHPDYRKIVEERLRKKL